jgi:hypothetical protein
MSSAGLELRAACRAATNDRSPDAPVPRHHRQTHLRQTHHRQTHHRQTRRRSAAAQPVAAAQAAATAQNQAIHTCRFRFAKPATATQQMPPRM